MIVHERHRIPRTTGDERPIHDPPEIICSTACASAMEIIMQGHIEHGNLGGIQPESNAEKLRLTGALSCFI